MHGMGVGPLVRAVALKAYELTAKLLVVFNCLFLFFRTVMLGEGSVTLFTWVDEGVDSHFSFLVYIPISERGDVLLFSFLFSFDSLICKYLYGNRLFNIEFSCNYNLIRSLCRLSKYHGCDIQISSLILSATQT
jgi:hypothetical protein